MNISALESGELLELYSGVLGELRRRGLVRIANDPVGDLGVDLFCGSFAWTREGGSSGEFNASTQAGARVLIKARRLTRGAAPIRSGLIHDKDGFDILALAFFAADFSIYRAIVVQRNVAMRYLRWSKRQKGWYIVLSQRFWLDPEVEDATVVLSTEHRRLMSWRS